MSKRLVGTVSGQQVYIETGLDEIALIEKNIRDILKETKVRDGKGLCFMFAAEDGDYIVEATFKRKDTL